MALPPRLKQKRNRSQRWRSPSHCNFVRSHACSVPDCREYPIEVAHLRIGTDAGMGRKASDFYTISLCRWHHAEQHNVGEESFATLRHVDLHALAREFCNASPKRRDIDEAKRERGL